MTATHLLAKRRAEALERAAEVLSDLGAAEQMQDIRGRSRGFESAQSAYTNALMFVALAEVVAAQDACIAELETHLPTKVLAKK
jgi:hypothetical protein